MKSTLSLKIIQEKVKLVKSVICVLLEKMLFLEKEIKMQTLFLSVKPLEKVKTFVVSHLSVLQEKGLMMH